MNLFKDFVSNYKDVLNASEMRKIQYDKSDIAKNGLFSVALFLIVFLIMGYIANKLENLYYVFFIVNTTILGSFLLVNFSIETKIKIKHNFKYNVGLLVIYESLRLLQILLFVNSILFFLYFQGVLSIIFIMTLFPLSIGISIYLFIVKRQLTIFQIKHRRLVDGSTSLLHIGVSIILMYISLFVILGIESIVTSYIISTTIIVVIYIVKTQVTNTTKPHLKTFWRFMILLLVVVSIQQGRTDLDLGGYPSTLEKKSRLLLEPLPNTNQQLLFDSGWYVVLEDTNYTYIQTSTEITAYDDSFNSVISTPIYIHSAYTVDGILHFIVNTWEEDDSKLTFLSGNYENKVYKHIEYSIDTEGNLVEERIFYSQLGYDIVTFLYNDTLYISGDRLLVYDEDNDIYIEDYTLTEDSDIYFGSTTNKLVEDTLGYNLSPSINKECGNTTNYCVHYIERNNTYVANIPDTSVNKISGTSLYTLHQDTPFTYIVEQDFLIDNTTAYIVLATSIVSCMMLPTFKRGDYNVKFSDRYRDYTLNESNLHNNERRG